MTHVGAHSAICGDIEIWLSFQVNYHHHSYGWITLSSQGHHVANSMQPSWETAFWTWWSQAWGLPIYVVKMALNRKRDTGLVQNAFLLLSITFVLHNVHLKPTFMPSVYLFHWCCVQWVFGWTAGFIHEKPHVHVQFHVSICFALPFSFFIWKMKRLEQTFFSEKAYFLIYIFIISTYLIFFRFYPITRLIEIIFGRILE